MEEFREIFGLDSIWEEDWGTTYVKRTYEEKEFVDNTPNVITHMLNIPRRTL